MKSLHGWKRKRIRESDLVQVRPEEEIRATLDRNSRCKGLEFMRGMSGYCGQVYKVARKLDKIVIDEKRGIMAQCKKGIFILEGLYCEGDVGEFAECDRNCALMWREEWLEKVA